MAKDEATSSGSSGDGNVGGPKVEIASELAGYSRRTFDSGNWSRG
jgi:hypothetical protein